MLDFRRNLFRFRKILDLFSSVLLVKFSEIDTISLLNSGSGQTTEFGTSRRLDASVIIFVVSMTSFFSIGTKFLEA